MIGRLTGRVARRQASEALIDVAGVGYRVAIPFSTFCALPNNGEDASLEIYTLVREDAITLYGFATEAEQSVFASLLSVSGVGPKVALAILSGMAPDEVVAAVESGEAPRLKMIPGVGKKLAERIVLELKEKILKLGIHPKTVSSGAPRGGEEAESALQHLGYGEAESREAVRRVKEAAGVPLAIEALLREALRILAR